MIAATLPWVLLLLVLAAGVIYCGRQRRARLAAAAEAERLNHWLHHNLRAIRSQVDYFCPEAVSVCNSLERALPARCVVDADGLERHLITLRRARNAAVLAGHDGGVR
jgi:hypothetical protein